VLAERTGARVVFGYVLRRPSCQHAISVEQVRVEQGKSGRDHLTLDLVERLERVIQREPTQWLWSLDRWRGTTALARVVC
jgi:lauroyl/myristoyl acyltransferase